MASQYASEQPAGFKNRIEKVAIVGAGGTMGSRFVAELLKTGRHTITALTRQGSKHTIPDGVNKAFVDYDKPETLVEAMRGHDILIVTLNVRAPPDTSKKLYEAAGKAGIKYAVPNSYGPNPFKPNFSKDMGFGDVVATTEATIKANGLTALFMPTGFWYEFSLAGTPARYGFDFKKRSLILFDEGDVKIYTSTWKQCGRAMAALLSLPLLPQDASDKQPTISKYLGGGGKAAYISSFHVSQKDMFESVKRVTKTTDADWTITHENTKERWEKSGKIVAAGPAADPVAFYAAFSTHMYTRTFFPGGDGLTDADIANTDLGLPVEDIDEATAEAIRMDRDGDLLTYGQ